MIQKISIYNFNILIVIQSLILLSALRNISFFYHILIFLLCGIIIIGIIKNNLIPSGFLFLIFSIYFLFSIWLIPLSGIYMQSWNFLPGIPRLFMVLVFTMLAFMVLKDEKKFISMLRVLLFCYFIGALSVIYQIFFGEISWFAPQFMRAHLNRYSSILGSLTIYGAIVGYGLLMVYTPVLFKKKLLFKIIVFVSLLSGAFFSLSKAGIVMIGLSFVVYLLFDFKSIVERAKLKSVLLLFVSLSSIFLILIQFDNFNIYYNSIVTQTIGSSSIFSSGDEVFMDSPSVSIESISKRLFYWTSGMYEDYGDMVLFSGVGFQGGAGTLGVLAGDGSHFASSHNALGDIFFIGGPLYLSLFILLFCTAQFVFIKDRANKTSRLFFMLNILFMANLLVASGSIWHPAISLPFWLSIVYANFRNKVSHTYLNPTKY